MRTIWLGLTVGLVLVAAHACSNDFTKFNFDGVPSGGAAGAGLTGGGGSGGGGTGGTGGAPSECNSAAQCPGQNTTCRVRSCASHHCGFANTIKGVECTEDNGEICNGHGLCVAATCSDGVRTGNETGVDCGGPCPPCGLGEECLIDGDCQSRFCDRGTGGSGGGAGTGGSGGVAGAGGSAGAAGTAGSGGGPLVRGHCTACGHDSDCADLPDAYCDGTSCLDRKADAAACTTAHECSSGQCPAQDLVCCDAPCDGTCEACLAAKTGAADGTCAAVTAPTDPDTECADQGPDSCGASGDGCNGDSVAPACTLYDDTTVCAVNVCAGDPPQEIATGLCSGAGVCEPGAPSSCAPYRCNGGASGCLTDCTANGDADCYGATYCDTQTHHCLSKLADGLDCAGPTECQSGFCADAKCCLTDCTASCMACSAAKKGGGANGTCGFVAAGTNPDSDCTATKACDGNGGCKLADGESCAVGTDCARGFCPAQDLVCCNAPCSGTCEACTAAKKGSGQDGACGYVRINTDPDSECAGLQNCNGSGVCI